MPSDILQRKRVRTDVRLEPLDETHANAMLRWLRDPEIRDHVGIRAEPSLERTLRWIDTARQDSTCHPFAICVHGQHVGNVVLDRLDSHLGTIRLSIFVGETRGSGVGRAAVALAVQHAFTALCLRKVWLTVHCENQRAIRLYQGVGFQIEGRLRDEFLLQQRHLDALYMGVLARDWIARRDEEVVA